MTQALSLQTRRLELREFAPDDAAAIQEYAGDVDVVRFLDWGPNAPEDTAQFLARARAARDAVPRAAYHLGIVLRAGGALIGGCRIEIRSAENENGDLGYVLGRRHWGRGYATEAVQSLLDFGFRRLELHRIWATCDVDNHASARVLEKVGMRREGRLRQIARRHGEWRDSYLYALLGPEWAASPNRT